MWILPLLVCAALVWILWLLQRSDRFRARRAVHRYYYRYRALLEDLERIRLGLVTLFQKVSVQLPHSTAGFVAYEKLVVDFERLLMSLKSIPSTSPNLMLLKSIEVLAKDLSTRLGVAQDMLSGKTRSNAHKALPTKVMEGCYFCSKPALVEPLRRIRIKIDSDLKVVLGCALCREAVKRDRTAKVLYFVKNGKSVHWSESEDYRPEESYFQINAPGSKELGRSQLRLVYSTIEDPSDRS
jgi:hypothetical protein